MQSFAEIIAAWHSPEDFAADAGVSPKLVAVWKHRSSIPANYWDRIVAGAERRRIEGVTLSCLSALARVRVEKAPSEAAD